MVVAEVPLWVVHSNANSPGSSKNPEPNNNSNNGTKNGKASESLLLLDGTSSSSSSSSAGLQKAAIYSIAVYGNRFATGGGDGTVRIWNAKALFPKPKSAITSRYKKPERVVSSDENEDIVMGNTLATNAANKTYESSGESSQDDESISPNSPDSQFNNNNNDNNDNNNTTSNTTSNTSNNRLSTSPVRDLTSVVRRKGEASKQKSKETPITNGTTSPTTTSATTTTKTNKKNIIASKHRLLCTLSAHTGSSVLCVRFSHNGKYLASAGDDAVVCVYAKQEFGIHGSGNNLESNLEHWVRIKLCRGHGLDALGLAWAPDDSHLVSCSLDSKTPIIVWKLTDLADETACASNNNNNNFYNNILCNPYKILGKGIHTSTVKGVTFDPAGTYLASSGDDPSVCVWRAHDDWGLEQKVDSTSGIFRKWQNSNTTTTTTTTTTITANLSSQSLFRRLSWSTDGAYICATNAVVKNKNVASTISREGWAVSSSKSAATGAVNLVGHKQPVVVACHCPYLLAASGQMDDNDNDNDNDNGNGSTCVESLKEYCPQSLEPTAIACGKCAQNNVANLMTAGCTIPIVTEFCQALGNPQIPIVVPETVLPTGATEDKPLRVFLQAGQSGCVGQASAQMMNNDPSYDEFKGVQEGVWFAGLKAGQGKGNQANSFFMRPLLAGEASDNGNKMGPEVAIGKRLYDAEGGESPVLIVKYCWGGSNLQKQWNPNTLQNSWDHRQDDGTAEWLLEETGEGGADLSDKTHLYANLIYTVRRSLELLDEANIPYKLSGMFWLQGAADKMRTWREYGEDTISFFEAVRSELGEPNLPMVSEGSTHHNTHTGKVYADSVISGCNSITVSMGIGAPNPDDTECVVGPSNPCMGSTFINYDLMNFYGYDPVISEPEFAFLKPPGASDKEFYWFKSFPTNQHMEYEGKILQGEMLSNAYIRSFTNDNLKPEWLKDDVVEQFPHYPCDPDINNGKPSEGNVCWMDQREDTDLAEATCSEMNYSSLVSSGGTTATMSLRSASSMSMLDTGVRIGAMTALLLLYIQ